MKVSDVFPSKFIAAADLQGQNVKVTVARVELEKIGEDTKPVIYFQGKQKGLVCNKTNCKAIAAIYGDETDDWVGGELVLFPIMTDYQGKPVEAVRVRAPQPKDRAAPRPPVQQASGDEAPF